ncbi:hypothetical protein CRYUN_Cryun18bG0064500 [Craigia yunnanensis]
MKLCFLALYNSVNEMAYDILKEQGEVILPYLTMAWADLSKAFLQDANWCYNKKTPKFEEYLENAWMSLSGPFLLAEIERGDTSGVLCGMRETGMSEESARKHISNLIDEAWKKMNKDGIEGSPLDKVLVEIAFNLAHQARCHYQ